MGSYEAYVETYLIFFTFFVRFFTINYRRFFSEALAASVFRVMWKRQTDDVLSVSCWVALGLSDRTRQGNYDSKYLSAGCNTGLFTSLPQQTLSRQCPLFCPFRMKKNLALFILTYTDKSDTLYDAKESYNPA